MQGLRQILPSWSCTVWDWGHDFHCTRKRVWMSRILESKGFSQKLTIIFFLSYIIAPINCRSARKQNSTMFPEQCKNNRRQNARHLVHSFVDLWHTKPTEDTVCIESYSLNTFHFFQSSSISWMLSSQSQTKTSTSVDVFHHLKC